MYSSFALHLHLQLQPLLCSAALLLESDTKMEAIISSCATVISDRSLAVIRKQFGYLCSYRKNVKNLKDQLQKLDAERADKSRSVAAAQRNVETIRSQTIIWQNKANKISEDANKFIEECEKERKRRYMMGMCPNPVSRYRFSRRACKKKTDIEEAMAEARGILKVADPAVGLGKEIALSTECLSFESRKSIMEAIMEVLQDETTKSIGVYGFGGMGKTTLAKQVAARAKEGKMFEEIVFAPVTQTVEVKKIQEKIASMLDLKVKGYTEAVNAGRISTRLKGKRVLIILDDLWKELDLQELGVSFGAEHLGCKILLTSRFGHVLTSMSVEKELKLGALKKEEAWRLFKEKTGSILENSDLRAIGEKVVERCQGLPVLIVTVAASLSKRRQLAAWNDALNQLETMNHKEMHDIVNSAIESISYNHLEKTHKQLFLLCGVLGGVASTETLLQYSLGWDLFDNPTQTVTIQKARDRLHALILDLKESCLLLDDVDSKKSIKMHDVVRDVAIFIGRKESNMLSVGEHGAELSIWPKAEYLERCTAMVLRGCPNLPSHLECPSLELFVMSELSEDSSPSIPESFFERTSKLKVLGLSKLSFSALPSSFSFLKNLQALRVNDCDSLKDISVVGELKELQTISFAGSPIEELPSGIGQLLKLRSLDVRGCYELKIIPAGLIQGLTRLEELYVSQNFDRWEPEECVSGSVKLNASLGELKHLHNLGSLEIDVGDVNLLPEDLHFEQLERYIIIVGDWKSRYGWLRYCSLRGWHGWWDFDVTRKFYLELSSTSINNLQHGVKMLFKSTECLYLGELKGINNIIPALDEDGFPKLKHLQIEVDYETQYVVNVEDKQRNVAFPCLESLQLFLMWKLQKICNGPLMIESFCNLTTVEVYHCNKLERLFSFSMATTRLPRLQKIQEMVFAQLRKLILECLPKLNNFFSISHNGNEEEELKSSFPFFTKVLFPKLEDLHMGGISSFKYLLTSSVATSLVGLKSLYVRDCAGMKHLVVAEKEGKTNIETNTFPQLSSLYLCDLPNLTKIYSEMGSNDDLDTSTQPLFSEKVSFLKLQKLKLHGISNLTLIWSHKFQEISCNNLTTLKISGCKSLKHVFPTYVAPYLNILEYLRVEDCEEVKTIIGDENRENGEIIKATQHAHDVATFIFAKLTKVRLQKLPKVECFYSREHIIEYPALTSIHVSDSGKLSTFDFFSFPEKQGDKLSEKVMSKLEGLTIRNNELMKIQLYDHFPTHLFSSLKKLRIVEFHGGSVVFPLTSFKSLEDLTISRCEMMEKVIGDNDEEPSRDNNEIIFPNLWTLKLEWLPRLTSFCSSTNYSFSFPILRYVTVIECPNMKTFCGGTTTTPELESVCYNFDMERWGGDLNTAVQQIFAENEKAKRKRKRNSAEQSEDSDNPTESSKGTETFEEGTVPDHTREKGKGKGKEPEVSEQVMEIASSSKLSNHFEEFQRLTTTLPSTSSNNQEAEESKLSSPIYSSNINFEVEAQLHDELSKKVSDEPITEAQICADKSAKMEVTENSAKAQNDATNLSAETNLSLSTELVRRSTSMVEAEATDPKKGSEIDEEVLQGAKLADICDRAQEQLHPPISNSLQVTSQQKDRIHDKSVEKVNDEPIREAEIGVENFVNKPEICDQEVVEEGHVAHARDKGKGKEYDVSEVTDEPINETSHCLETEPETSIASPSSHEESFRGLRETFQILEAQPMSRVSTEQVRFMEEASDWFCGYVRQAREYLEQKELISELELKIGDMEAQLLVLKEKKRVAEEKKNSASRVDKFG